ncbi:MAG: hypothetical protein WCA80_07055 [Candidatus Aquilonibacter sp.]
MKARVAFLVVVAATAILAACGGGSGGPTPVTLATYPSAISTSAPFSTSTTTLVKFAEISNGASGTITLPAANAAATANLSFQAALPTGVATPAAVKGRAVIGGTNLTTLAVITLSVSSPVTIASTPAFSFTLSGPVSGNAYIAYYDENNAALGWNVLLGPGTVSADTVSFAAVQLAPPVTFVPGDTYVFALITSSTVAASPALTYSGTKTVNYVYGPGFNFGYPAPSPGTTAPPATLSYTVSDTVSTGSSPFPGPSTTGLVDEHVAESDVQNLSTTNFTTDSWVGIASANAVYSELLYGSTQQEPSSANLPTTTTIFATPHTTDEFPAQTGQEWTNGAAATTTYSYADSDNGTKVVASDGTYVDTENLLAGGAGGTATLTENSDGSGSIVGPYFGGGIVSQVTFSAPTPAASPTAVVVTLDFTAFAQSQYGYPASEPVTDGLWYPLPLVLSTESGTITAGVQLPASCKPNALNLTTADLVARQITVYDTVIGYNETTDLNSYEYNGQPVCLVSTDTLSYAYDQQGNQPYFIFVSQLGFEVVTTSETLILQAAAPGASATTSAASRAGMSSNGVLSALEQHEMAAFTASRLARTHDFIQALRSRNTTLRSVQGGSR